MKSTNYILLGMLMASTTFSSCTPEEEPLSVKVDRLIQAYYPDDQEPGIALLISRDGETILTTNQGMANLEEALPLTDNARFRMASVSKQFTARAVHLLYERDQLALSDPLSTFFDDLPEVMREMTVSQLVTHTSGLWDYETLIPEDQQTQLSDHDVLRMVRTVDTVYFAPGNGFRYSNSGYCVLSLIVEQVSGMPYADFMHQETFAPLNMPDAGLFQAGVAIQDRVFGYRPGRTEGEGFQFADQSITSATKGDGCVYLSSEEYMKWFEALITPTYLQDMAQIQVPVKDGVSYGFGWFMLPGPGQDSADFRYLAHSGQTTGFRNVVFHDLETNVSVVLFTNRSDHHLAEIFAGVLDLLGVAEPLPAAGNLFHWMASVYGE